MHLIMVEPFGDGWTVRSSQVDNDMPFRSGAAAETAAKALAERLARAGEAAEIRVFLRDGALAARFVSPAILAIDAGVTSPRRRGRRALAPGERQEIELGS